MSAFLERFLGDAAFFTVTMIAMVLFIRFKRPKTSTVAKPLTDCPRCGKRLRICLVCHEPVD